MLCKVPRMMCIEEANYLIQLDSSSPGALPPTAKDTHKVTFFFILPKFEQVSRPVQPNGVYNANC